MADISDELLTLLTNVAEDVTGITECNCSYTSDTALDQRCDGTCTYSMAKAALKLLYASPIPDPAAAFIGHTEDLTYLVHRCETGDTWALVSDEDEDTFGGMRDRLIDSGGSLFQVTARAVVTAAKLIDSDVMEDEQ